MNAEVKDTEIILESSIRGLVIEFGRLGDTMTERLTEQGQRLAQQVSRQISTVLMLGLFATIGLMSGLLLILVGLVQYINYSTALPDGVAPMAVGALAVMLFGMLAYAGGAVKNTKKD
jgi:hypothetical protein